MTYLSYGPFLSRKQAMEQGLKQYFSGTPCRKGHVAMRYIQGQCSCCVLEQQKEKNKERAKTRFIVECPRCGKKRTRSGTAIGTTEANTSMCRSCAKELSHKRNPEAYDVPNAGRFTPDLSSPRHLALAAGEERYQGKACRHGHGHERYAKDGKCVICVAVRAAKRGAVWAANNRGKVNHTAAKRRAVKALATPAWLTQADWDSIEALYLQAAELTEQTGIEHEVDHIIPLQGKTVCGFHCPENLRVVTREENRRKHNKLIPD